MTIAFRNLKLDRPLAVIDCETTGLDVESDRIVELFIGRVWPGDGRAHDYATRIYPGVPIPPGASAIHGITDDQVEGKDAFEQLAPGFWAQLGDCDLLGFNAIRYDVPLLAAEFRRAGYPVIMAVRRILDPYPLFDALMPGHPRHTLAHAVAHYLGRSHAGAHGAAADGRAAAEVLDAMIEIHELPRDVESLAALCAVESRRQVERFASRRVGRWTPGR